jgi:phosphoglycerate dehydrogenase-like enzyme
VLKVLVVSRSLLSRGSVDPLAELKGMVSGDVEFVVPETFSEDELVRLTVDVDVIVGGGVSGRVVRSAERLRLIQTTGAGANHIPFDLFEDRDVFVANTSGANALRVAEGAFALVMALAKRIVVRHNKLQEGVAYRERSVVLRGKTLGILGLGSIGMEVARMGLAFGMRVEAIKRNPSKGSGELDLDFLGGPGDLERVLKVSDFVVVSLPLTPETEGLIGERELRVMKGSAFLVNIGRAEIVEEEPLYKALKEGWIAGAGLDVWYYEYWSDPAWRKKGGEAEPSRFPIHRLENVVATPHFVGSGEGRPQEMLEVIAENISRIARGENPIRQVDRKLRY